MGYENQYDNVRTNQEAPPSLQTYDRYLKEQLNQLQINHTLKRYLYRTLDGIVQWQKESDQNAQEEVEAHDQARVQSQMSFFLFDVKKQLNRVHTKYESFEFMPFLEAINNLHLLALDKEFSDQLNTETTQNYQH